MNTIIKHNKDLLQKVYANTGIPKESQKLETFEFLNEPISIYEIKKVPKSDLQRKSMDWFLYDTDFRHERNKILNSRHNTESWNDGMIFSFCKSKNIYIERESENGYEAMIKYQLTKVVLLKICPVSCLQRPQHRWFS